MVVLGRMVNQVLVSADQVKEDGGMVEMRELSSDNEEYAERPGRVLLPQSC